MALRCICRFTMLCLFTSITSGFIQYTQWIKASPLSGRFRSILKMSRKGTGMMPDRSYSWTESKHEIEVRMKVPERTKVSEIHYSIGTRSIDLTCNSKVLLRGKFIRKVNVDGCCWNFDRRLESNEEDDNDDETYKDVVLRLEKKFKVAHMEEEWHGVLDDASELDATKEYYFHERDKFDMKRYLEYMGGYNESLVDKTKFLNISDKLKEDLIKRGYVKETMDPMDEWRNATNQEKAAKSAERRAKMANATQTAADNTEETKGRGEETSTSGKWKEPDPSLFKNFDDDQSSSSSKKEQSPPDPGSYPKLDRKFQDMKVPELLEALGKLDENLEKSMETKARKFSEEQRRKDQKKRQS